MPEPPKRPHAEGIPLLSEEEMQEKRRRYLETIGAVIQNVENKVGKRNEGSGRRVFGDPGWRASGGSPHADPAGPLKFILYKAASIA